MNYLGVLIYLLVNALPFLALVFLLWGVTDWVVQGWRKL